jgi:predicted DNA-binding transcriptional regulator AlpA
MTLLNVRDVAERLKKSPHTIYSWISKGHFCGPLFRKIGESPMIIEADLENWIEQQPQVGGGE